MLVDGHIASVHEVTPESRDAPDRRSDGSGQWCGWPVRCCKGGRSGLQRVVKTPQRWNRIVALAQLKGIYLCRSSRIQWS